MLAALSIPAHLGYLALAGLVAAESMGLPVPGETALLAAGVLAHQQQLAIPLVIAVAATAAIVGDNLGYAIGRRGGRWLLERPGPLHAQRQRLLVRGATFFARHGPKAVFLGRFVTGARVTVAWMAGANQMPWRHFLLWNALGGITWATVIGLIGFLVGAAAGPLLRATGLAGIAIATVGVLVIALVVRHRREGQQPRNERTTTEKHEPGPSHRT